MFSVLGLRIRAEVTRLVTRIKRAVSEATRPRQLAVGALKDLTRSKSELIAENALLRQQLIVASRKVKRPEFKPRERGLLVLLARCVRGWRDALLLVKPDTILGWHRQGFRLFWRWKSSRPKVAKQRIADDVIALIRRMADENQLYVERPVMWSSGTHGLHLSRVRRATRDICFGESPVARCPSSANGAEVRRGLPYEAAQT